MLEFQIKGSDILKNDFYSILNINDISKKYSHNFSKISPYSVGIPLIDLSDKTIEETYYYRWFVFCCHIKKTPEGYVITEFLPDVPWAGKYNAISCPAGHHLYEGRWLYNSDYINSYIEYWFSKDAEPRKYSFWLADSVLAVSSVTNDYDTAKKYYEKIKENYSLWETEKLTNSGLYYQTDRLDGMEYSAGGSGLRPTINSYMYADALALAEFADIFGKTEDKVYFLNKAKELKEKINKLLWDDNGGFFKTYNIKENKLVNVKELIGYVPWCFNIPDSEKSTAFKFLNDKNYFYAPYGPTTTEQNFPDFMKKYEHECLWNGPSWPFATSQTLNALANLLCNYKQDIMDKSDYYHLLNLYANCHYLTENSKKVSYIDENLDPFTGVWLARKLLKTKNYKNAIKDRGKHYNHSTFCDLCISGLAGIRCSTDNTLTVNPLFNENDLDYFCADGIKYHGKYITVLWDKYGTRYNKGIGFKIYINGKEIINSSTITKQTFDL